MTARKVASGTRTDRSVANGRTRARSAQKPASNQGALRVGVRVLANSVIAMGPGKADLLDAIARTGSISAAARTMGMSYRRAWLLVDTMNTSFREPLVLKEKGGTDGGGAELSAMGKLVLRKYRALAEFAAKNFSDLLSAPNVS